MRKIVSETQYRAASDGGLGTLVGPLVLFGEIAPNTERGPERMLENVFGPVDRLNVGAFTQHDHSRELGRSTPDGGLVLTQDASGYHASLELQHTAHGILADGMARRGQLRGFSVEFDPVSEYRGRDGVINVVHSELRGLGIVDHPAYRGSRFQIRQEALTENILLSGPPGSGKSQRAVELRAETPGAYVADFQELYASILGLRRDPGTGRYPEREPDDAHALAMAEYLRVTLVNRAVGNGAIIIATNSRGAPERREQLLTLLGGEGRAREVVLDPGRAIVTQRLARPDGTLSGQCGQALAGWYDDAPAIRAERRRRRWL